MRVFIFLLSCSLLELVTSVSVGSTAQILQAQTTDSCFYSLFLANYGGTGFNDASVDVYADSSLIQTVTLAEGLQHEGFKFYVSSGQNISIVYNAKESEGSSENEIWISNANDDVVFYQTGLVAGTYQLAATSSCECKEVASSEECPDVRVRSEWRTLSHCARLLFVEALLTLRAKPELYNFYIVTHNRTASRLGQGGFLSWHRQFLHDFENELRNLGGKFSCVTVPYWDWSLDFGKENESSVYADFGGLSDGMQHLEYPFDWWTNPTTGDSLVRRRVPLQTSIGKEPKYINNLFTSQTAYQFGITSNNSFEHLTFFFARSPHSAPHFYVAGDYYGDFLLKSAPADPLFWLHHTTIDRAWALWQDCWDYDVDAPANHAKQYVDLSPFHELAIDDPFPLLVGNKTARDVLDMSSMGYRYAPIFDEWRRWGTDNEFCNWNWFSPAKFNELSVGTQNGDFPIHTRVRPPVFTEHQRTVTRTITESYQDSMTTHGKYEMALAAKLKSECSFVDLSLKDSDTVRDHRICGDSPVLCQNLCVVQKAGLLDTYAQAYFLPRPVPGADAPSSS